MRMPFAELLSHPLKMSVITALQLAREADPTSYPSFFD